MRSDYDTAFGSKQLGIFQERPEMACIIALVVASIQSSAESYSVASQSRCSCERLCFANLLKTHGDQGNRYPGA